MMAYPEGIGESEIRLVSHSCITLRVSQKKDTAPTVTKVTYRWG